MWRRVGFIVVIGGTGGACQIVAGYEDFDTAGSVTPVEPHRCDPIASSKVDTKGLAPMQLVKVRGGSCFWVDRDEVSVDQYRRFLAERGQPATFADRERCGWKVKPSDPIAEVDDDCTKSVSAESEPFLGEKAIRCVDWCDAREFCRWADKDLCASRNSFGTAEPPGQLDEWGIACSRAGDPFPYGRTPEDGRCNIGGRARCLASLGLECSVAKPDSFACTGETGARGMIGNVSEWVLSCAFGDGGPDVVCSNRGGGFQDALESASCIADTQRFASRKTRDRQIGFRCCSTLSPVERSVVAP